MGRKDELSQEIYSLELIIAEASAKKRVLREELNAILRAEVEERRLRLRSLQGPTKAEHAREGNLLITQECRDLCWQHNLPYVSNEIIGRLVSAGRIEGHQYKGGYFATKAAVLAFIERETSDPDSDYYEPPEAATDQLIA